MNIAREGLGTISGKEKEICVIPNHKCSHPAKEVPQPNTYGTTTKHGIL